MTGLAGGPFTTCLVVRVGGQCTVWDLFMPFVFFFLPYSLSSTHTHTYTHCIKMPSSILQKFTDLGPKLWYPLLFVLLALCALGAYFSREFWKRNWRRFYQPIVLRYSRRHSRPTGQATEPEDRTWLDELDRIDELELDELAFE